VQPKDENDLIRPAVDGTLRVLKAAKASGTVKRVVVTSSAAAISYGTPYVDGKVYTEADFSDPDGKGSYISPYAKSKTLAEKAAWDFMEREGGSLELAVVNPHAIYGPPLLVPCESTTVGVIQQFLQGRLPAVPNISFGIIDVRDVASLHMLAATKPEAAGQRYSCLAGKSMTLAEMGGALKAGLGAKASKAPTRTMPNFVVKLLSYVMAQLGPLTHDLGKRKEFSNEKAKALGWSPRSNEEAVVSCAEALIDAGVCK
jgi:dihydroflavonol-4-reductase